MGVLIARSFEWWAKRAEADVPTDVYAGVPDPMVSHRAMATAIGGPGPRLQDELGSRWWLRQDLAKTSTNTAMNALVDRMYRDFHTDEYRRLDDLTLDPEYLASLREWVERELPRLRWE